MKTNLKTTLFTMENCAPCAKLKEWIADKDVEVEIKAVEEYTDEAGKYNNKTMPFMVVTSPNGELIKQLKNSAECKKWVGEMML